MNQTVLRIVTALVLLGSASENALAQVQFQGLQVTTATASTSSKPLAKPKSEPVELTGMLAAHNETRAKAGVPSLKWSSELEAAAQKVAKAGSLGSCGQGGAEKAGKSNNASIFWAPGLRRLGQPTAQDIKSRFVVSRWSEARSDQLTRMTSPKAKTVGCARLICGNQSQVWACKYDD